MTDSLGEVEALVDRFIAAWNETNDEARRALIAQCWSENGIYLDPQKGADGRAALDATIAGVQALLPRAAFRRTSAVDAHHDRVRFSWELGYDSGEVIRGGVDFGTVSEGRLQSITGFFD